MNVENAQEHIAEKLGGYDTCFPGIYWVRYRMIIDPCDIKIDPRFKEFTFTYAEMEPLYCSGFEEVNRVASGAGKFKYSGGNVTSVFNLKISWSDDMEIESPADFDCIPPILPQLSLAQPSLEEFFQKRVTSLPFGKPFPVKDVMERTEAWEHPGSNHQAIGKVFSKWLPKIHYTLPDGSKIECLTESPNDLQWYKKVPRNNYSVPSFL